MRNSKQYLVTERFCYPELSVSDTAVSDFQFTGAMETGGYSMKKILIASVIVFGVCGSASAQDDDIAVMLNLLRDQIVKPVVITETRVCNQQVPISGCYEDWSQGLDRDCRSLGFDQSAGATQPRLLKTDEDGHRYIELTFSCRMENVR